MEPPIPNVTAEDLAGATDQWHRMHAFERTMSSYGIEIKPGSRFWKYRRRMLEKYPAPATAPTLIRPAEARISATMGLEARRMLFCARVLHRDPEWIALLKMAVSGSDLPSDGGDHRPRDHQFHAYIAALLAAAGKPALHKEPDIVSTITGLPFCCAVKRASSASRLGELLRGGLRQIRSAGFAGAIVADVSRLVTPYDNLRLTTDGKDEVEYLNRRLRALGEEHGQKLFPAPPYLFGMTLFATVMAFQPSRGCFMPCHCWVTHPLWRPRDIRTRRLREFHETLEKTSRVLE